MAMAYSQSRTRSRLARPGFVFPFQTVTLEDAADRRDLVHDVKQDGSPA